MEIHVNQFSIWILGKASLIDFISCPQEMQHIIDFSECRAEFWGTTVRFPLMLIPNPLMLIPKPNKMSSVFTGPQKSVTNITLMIFSP